jgi:hypothetical protein
MIGKYTGRAQSWELTENDAGEVSVVVQFRLEGNPEHDGTVRTWRGYFKSDKSQEIAIKALRTVGWSGDDIMDLSGLDSNLVELDINEEEYNGKVYDKVNWVNVIGGGLKVKPLSEDRRRAFAEGMKGKIAMVTQRMSQRNTGAPTPAASLGEDGLPF